jgi:hypothetical protein
LGWVGHKWLHLKSDSFPSVWTVFF